MRIDLKMEKMSQKALERKSNKPIMEKKRRARINHCLNQLKALILETDNERSRHSKLEKADILEMTVRYLQTLRAYHLHLTQLHQIQPVTQQQPLNQQLLQFQQQQQQQQNQTPSPTILNLSALHQQQQNQLAAQLQLQLQPLQLQQSPQQSPQSHLLHQLHHHHHTAAQISPTWRPW